MPSGTINLKNLKFMALLKLTERIPAGYGKAEYTTRTVLIETKQIITVKRATVRSGDVVYIETEIKSVGGMVTTTHVIETPEEIFKMYSLTQK